MAPANSVLWSGVVEQDRKCWLRWLTEVAKDTPGRYDYNPKGYNTSEIKLEWLRDSMLPSCKDTTATTTHQIRVPKVTITPSFSRLLQIAVSAVENISCNSALSNIAKPPSIALLQRLAHQTDPNIQTRVTEVDRLRKEEKKQKAASRAARDK